MAKQVQTKEDYKDVQKKHEIKRPIFENCIKALLIVRFICLIEQVISMFYIYFFEFTEYTAGNLTVATLIFLTMLLTEFGLYEKIAQFTRAGTAVPVTGFGNAVISS